MKEKMHWVPSFVTGAAATARVAVVLLLYSGERMLRSLTWIMAVELAAMGLGLEFQAIPRAHLLDDPENDYHTLKGL